MKLYIACTLAFCLLLEGCGIDSSVGEAPTAQEPAPPAAVMGDSTEAPVKQYAGLWHAGDSVGSGYAARYEFYEDGTFIYAASEMDDEADVLLMHGSWKLSGDGASLLLQIDERLIQVSAATDGRIPLSYNIIKPPLMETHTFRDGAIDAKSGYPVILIDGKPFYRLENVPALLDEYAAIRKHVAKYTDCVENKKLGSAGGLFTMPEDIDADGKDEAVYYEANQNTLYLLRENGGAAERVGEPFYVEAPVKSVEHIRLQGSPYTYVFITQTPSPEAESFALARMLDDGALCNIDTSRFKYDKREDRIADFDLDGVYDGYFSEGSGLDSLNMYTLAAYAWNAEEELFTLTWMSVDVGPYTDSPEKAVRKYLALKFMEYGNAEEVEEMLKKLAPADDSMFDAGLLDGMEADILSEESQSIILRPLNKPNDKTVMEAVIENKVTGMTKMLTFVLELQGGAWRITGLFVGDNSAN